MKRFPKNDFLLVAVLLLLVPPFLACNASPNGVSFLEGDFSSPQLEELAVKDSSHILLGFSKPVTAQTVEVGTVTTNALDETVCRDFDSIIPASYTAAESRRIEVELGEKTQAGGSYGLRGAVADSSGNTLTFASYFTGYNENVPKLVLSEVQTEYSKPKCEFVEIYVQGAGNLAGVCIYSAYDGEEKRYEFPPIDVKQGEYVVVHLRKVEEACQDETGADLALSGGAYSSAEGRDLWVDNTAARLGKNDVILLEERANGKVLDALFLAESKYSAWPKQAHAAAAQRAFADGAWPEGAGIDTAVVSDGVTATRSVSRQGDLQSAKPCGKFGWIVTAMSGATPGKANSTKAYVK